MTVVPGMTRRYILMHAADDQRRVLRSITVGFAEMILAIGVAGGVFLRDAPGATGPWLVGICLGLMAAPLLGRRLQRPLDCTSDIAMVDSFRTRLFVRASFGNLPVLAGLVVTSFGGPIWLLAVGVLVSLGALVIDAPTRSNLEREDQALRADGCDRSLVAALAAGAL